jgi:hypothetical protein
MSEPHCNACGQSVLDQTCAAACNEWPTGRLVHDCLKGDLWHEECLKEWADGEEQITFNSPFDFFIGQLLFSDEGSSPIGKVLL